MSSEVGTIGPAARIMGVSAPEKRPEALSCEPSRGSRDRSGARARPENLLSRCLRWLAILVAGQRPALAVKHEDRIVGPAALRHHPPGAPHPGRIDRAGGLARRL